MPLQEFLLQIIPRPYEIDIQKEPQGSLYLILKFLVKIVERASWAYLMAKFFSIWLQMP